MGPNEFSPGDRAFVLRRRWYRDAAEHCRWFGGRPHSQDWRARRPFDRSPTNGLFSWAIRTISSSTSRSIGGRPGARRKALAEVATAAQPANILAWYRRLVTCKFDRAPARKPLNLLFERPETWVTRDIAGFVRVRRNPCPCRIVKNSNYSN